MIYHDKPTSVGMENALKRAAQLREIRWTPVAKLPMTSRFDRKQTTGTPYSYYQTWKPQNGIPYSSVSVAEKFVGFNVSLETYITALANPEGVLYHKNLTGTRARTTSWYGSVCSVYVGYVLDLPCRRVCRRWGTFGDMEYIGPVLAAQDIKLCDILCNDHHVGIVTDVARDVNGTVVAVTVSECTPPKVLSVEYSPEELYHCWLKKYEVFRYLYIDKVPYVPSPYIHLEGDPDLPVPPVNKVLLPDYGNKANYAMGEAVELNVMAEGWETLCIQKDGQTVFTAPIAGPGVISWTPETAGRYTAYCEKAGAQSDPVEFAVTEIHNTAVVRGDTAEVTMDCKDKVLCCMLSKKPDFETVYYHNLTEEESAARKVLMTGLIPGEYTLKTIAVNDFGQYMSPLTEITVE